MLKSIFLLILVLIFIACSPNEKRNEPTTQDTVGEKAETPTETPKEKISKWFYSEKVDKMTSEVKKFAWINANELLHFDFPYDGGSTATLTIRKANNDIDIYISVSKGQFTSTYDNQFVTVRFDDNPPQKIKYLEPADHSSDLIFLTQEKEILKNIKKSKKMLVEAMFFNEGNRVMEFNIENLVFD